MRFSASDGSSADNVNVVEAFDLPATSQGVIDFDAEFYEIDDTVEMVVRDIDLDGNPSVSVTVTSTGGDTEQVSLASEGLGVFRGSIQLTTGAAAPDGILQADIDQTLEVTYQDANADGIVVAADFAATRAYPRNFLSPAMILTAHDFNRDRRVDAADLLIVRDHVSTLDEALVMIEPPVGLLAKQAEGFKTDSIPSVAKWTSSEEVGLIDQAVADETDWLI